MIGLIDVGGGINVDLATDLDANFTWTPPLASQSQVDDELEGPESLMEDEVAAAFDETLQNFHQLMIPSWTGSRSWWDMCMTLQSWNRLTKESPLQDYEGCLIDVNIKS